MTYLLPVHCNENIFQTMPQGTREDMLTESIPRYHQPNDDNHSEAIPE